MKLAKVLAVAAVAALVSGAAVAQDIKIGASLPLTGGFAINGQKHQSGYQLCVDLINDRGGIMGRDVSLLVSDNRSDTETAINQYERFINVDNVDAVFGTFSSKLSFPVANVLNKNNMVHLLPAGGALRIYTQGYKNIFYFQPDVAERVGASIQGLIEDLVPAGDRPAKAAVVSADDFFANGIWAGLLGEKVMDPGDGSVVADMAPGYLADAGVDVVYQERWPEEGFSDWLNLANSIKRSGADMIVALTASAEEAVQLTRALTTVKASAKLVYMSQGTQAEFAEGAGDAANGIVIHSSWHKDAPFQSVLGGESFSNADFVKAFQDKYGEVPDEDSAIPFAVCQGMEQAMDATGTTDNEKIGQWLSARTADDPVHTILGDFHWDDTGLPEDKPFLMTQWQDGDLKFVYPKDAFEGVSDLIYPKGSF